VQIRGETTHLCKSGRSFRDNNRSVKYYHSNNISTFGTSALSWWSAFYNQFDDWKEDYYNWWRNHI